MTEPKALRLADALAWHESAAVEQAAAELRRLHALNAELVKALRYYERESFDGYAQPNGAMAADALSKAKES